MSARKQISLVRDEIKLEDQEAKAEVIEMPGVGEEPVRLGVINLPSFYASFDVGNRRQELAGQDAASAPKSTTVDVERLIKKLKREKVGGIILDLRRNGGGSLEEAIRLTGLFIKDGPVVQVREPGGKVQIDDDPDPSIVYDGPLIVLTSRFSASASEILAGALQDYGRALIVGDSSTHGKGTVQSVNPLRPFMHLADSSLATNEPGALKVTIKKFYRASGASTQLKGVIPDIILPSVLNESKEVGESALDNPLDWDTIKSAKYDKMNMVEPFLPELQKRSAERVAADKEYSYVREDIELYQKQQADKTISLNEKQRLKEKDDAEARRKAREQERRTRREPKEIVHEINLRQVDLPGLPPPVEKTNTSVAKLTGQKGGFSAGAATNAPVAAAGQTPAPGSTGGDDALDEDHAPGVPDVSLTEAEHILMDYLTAMGKINFTAARRE
jgi:carboxyl-terminal processing protease